MVDDLIEELHAWVGIDKDFLLYHLSDSKNESFSVISMKLTKLLKEQDDKAQKNKDKIK